MSFQNSLQQPGNLVAWYYPTNSLTPFENSRLQKPYQIEQMKKGKRKVGERKIEKIISCLVTSTHNSQRTPMAATQSQQKCTIWDFPYRWEDYQLPRFAILDACKKNDLNKS